MSKTISMGKLREGPKGSISAGPRPISTSVEIDVHSLDAIGGCLRLVATEVEPDDLGTPWAAGKADSSIVRSRRIRNVPRSSVSSLAMRSSGRMGSFCRAGHRWACGCRP